ncbi:hypothetical protein [Pseudomonas aeruginosa]|uniref:hypothetical protein n=1 Tax=Pseudomonas aeruginosa TaxID=287 RepID=UPI00053D611C|nr:hypothetical protein [Pseudomonas aeruginosa]HCE0605667.1 hypothetical protein [Pseudomonas aeruginosa]HCG0413707.1 hypothetical protein [Pseudomonas aeruginosa]HCG0453118.1 hypothetical protein [Pseudomonas aeruginosa]
MSSLTGKEVQIVNALSSADLPENIIGESCVKQLISAVVDAQQQASGAADRLQSARAAKANQNVISNWWNNTEDRVKDAQLNLTTTVANLNRHSSQLLIFNTAISKVLCDQQDLLLRQQKILEQQAEQLKQQNLDILEQQKTLEVQQTEIGKANQGLMEAKGVTAEQARNLVGCVQRVEATEERISEVNRQLLVAIEQHLNHVREELGSSQASAVNTLEARDKQLLQLIQDQQQKLSGQSSLQQTLDERLKRLEESLPVLLEVAVSKHMASVSQRADAMEQRYAQLRKGFILGLSAVGVAMLGLAAAVSFLLVQ